MLVLTQADASTAAPLRSKASSARRSGAIAAGTEHWLKEQAAGIRGARLEALPAVAGPPGLLAEAPGIYALRISDREQRHFWAARQQDGRAA